MRIRGLLILLLYSSKQKKKGENQYSIVYFCEKKFIFFTNFYRENIYIFFLNNKDNFFKIFKHYNRLLLYYTSII